jgi:hypothetical protein
MAEIQEGGGGGHKGGKKRAKKTVDTHRYDADG